MQRPASIQLGPYQLLERIGEGGSGQVWRANGPDGLVAVKMLGPMCDLDDAARARFAREIRALEQIVHPNLVRMLGHGIDDELGPYLVLPLLPGTSVRALCASRAIGPEATLLLVQPIAEATAALHAAGYVHRDLKPENVVATPDGSITVIDLGLAWRDGMTRHTDTGAAVGSVGYMAPEQIEGGKVGTAVDVWALGVILYELVAGKRPFARARPAEEAAAAMLGACAKLSAADRRADDALSTLVARCLALDPAARPTAALLAAAIAHMIDWTDDVAGERAAAVADPSGYQARVTAFRVTRAARAARTALDANAPFEALAHCDRGLAYAPDHAGLLALVAAAEAATAKPQMIADAPSSPVVATHAISATHMRASRRWWWAVGAIMAISIGVPTAMHVLGVSATPQSDDSWAHRSANPVPPLKLVPTENDKAVIRDFASLFGRAMASAPADPSKPGEPRPMTANDREMARDLVSLFGEVLASSDASTPMTMPHGDEPTTAEAWLELAKSQIDHPAQAIASTRNALALAPHWLDAEMLLCGLLTSTSDPGALDSCEPVTVRKPNDLELLAFRGLARAHAGKTADALADLDRVIAGDPDPKYLRVRGTIRKQAGDHTGAQADFEAACKAGNARACTEMP